MTTSLSSVSCGWMITAIAGIFHGSAHVSQNIDDSIDQL